MSTQTHTFAVASRATMTRSSRLIWMGCGSLLPLSSRNMAFFLSSLGSAASAAAAPGAGSELKCRTATAHVLP
eukprot:3322734-Rhodomonas_salina.2